MKPWSVRIDECSKEEWDIIKKEVNKQLSFHDANDFAITSNNHYLNSDGTLTTSPYFVKVIPRLLVTLIKATKQTTQSDKVIWTIEPTECKSESAWHVVAKAIDCDVPHEALSAKERYLNSDGTWTNLPKAKLRSCAEVARMKGIINHMAKMHDMFYPQQQTTQRPQVWWRENGERLRTADSRGTVEVGNKSYSNSYTELTDCQLESLEYKPATPEQAVHYWACADAGKYVEPVTSKTADSTKTKMKALLNKAIAEFPVGTKIKYRDRQIEETDSLPYITPGGGIVVTCKDCDGEFGLYDNNGKPYWTKAEQPTQKTELELRLEQAVKDFPVGTKIYLQDKVHETTSLPYITGNDLIVVKASTSKPVLYYEDGSPCWTKEQKVWYDKGNYCIFKGTNGIWPRSKEYTSTRNFKVYDTCIPATPEQIKHLEACISAGKYVPCPVESEQKTVVYPSTQPIEVSYADDDRSIDEIVRDWKIEYKEPTQTHRSFHFLQLESKNRKLRLAALKQPDYSLPAVTVKTKLKPLTN